MAAQQDATGKTKVTDLEKRAVEVGTRLVHYRAISRREVRTVEPLADDAPAEQPGVSRLRRRDRQEVSRDRRPAVAVAARARRPQVARHLLARHPGRRSGGAGDRLQVRRQVHRVAPRQLGLDAAAGPARLEGGGPGRRGLPQRQERGVPERPSRRSTRPRPRSRARWRRRRRRPWWHRHAGWANRSAPTRYPTPEGDGPGDLFQRVQPVFLGAGRLFAWPWRCWP